MNLIDPHLTKRCLFAALVAAVPFAPLRAQLAAPAGSDKTAAEKAVRLEEFEVIEPRTSAQSMAPTESRLEATQPESIINLQTIQNSIVPTADYATIAALAPSVVMTATPAGNGPGLTESKATMRGFGDGQYNVTIDGIPFGDGNDYTHHTTSYFPVLPVS